MRAFDRIHCVLDTSLKYRRVLAYMNLDYLYAGLYAKGRRVLKKDMLDLPPKLISEIQVTLIPDHKRLYDQLVEEQLLEVGDRIIDATEAGSMYSKSQQLLLNPEFFTDTPIKKNAIFEAMDELLHSIGGRKVLIYAWYTNSVSKILQRYSHLNPAVLNGSVQGLERERMKQKFIQDPSCKMIVANPKSGGVGVDGFQAVCSRVIFAEICTVPGAFLQAVDRLHRTGQKMETVNIYLLVVKGTISVKLRNNLARKEADGNKVTRDKKTLLAELTGQEILDGLGD